MGSHRGFGVIALAAIATLWLTGSIEHATAIGVLILIPLGVTRRR